MAIGPWGEADGAELVLSNLPPGVIRINRGQLFFRYNLGYLIRAALDNLPDSPVPFDKKHPGFPPPFADGKHFIPFDGL